MTALLQACHRGGSSDSTTMDVSRIQDDDLLEAVATIQDVSTDAMNYLLSFLTFADYLSLSLCSKSLNGAVSRASHLIMEESSATGTVTDYSGTSRADRQSSRIIRLDETSLKRLLHRYQGLQVLHLNGLAAVGDSLFFLLNESPAAQHVTSLALHGVSLSYWCPNALDFPQLKHLKISGGTIRAALSKLFGGGGATEPTKPKLESVSIKQCSSLRDEHVVDLVQQLDATLESLSLHQCLRVKKPVLQLSNLKHASLMGCFALTDLPRFKCPNLVSLDLSFCFRISTDRIQRIVESVPALQELTLIKCPSLHSLKLSSDNLRVLSVNFCNSLTRLQLTDCPNLQQLDNIACSSLDTVLLHNVGALQTLSFAGQPVTRLELHANSLSCLNLAGCRWLDQCSIYAPALKQVNAVGSRTVALRHCKTVRQVMIDSWST